MTNKRVVIFGGAGFLGKQIVRILAKEQYQIVVASRHPDKSGSLRCYGPTGNVLLQAIDIKNAEQLEDIISKADIVINLVGLLFSKRKQNFTEVHTKAAERIAKLCTQYSIEKFIHLSSLGVDKATTSQYASSKLEAEQRIKQAYPNVSIIRPSIIIGPDDNFFNLFAKLAKWFSVLPLIGGGQTKFQPVYVGDVAQAVLSILQNQGTKAKTYELGGPDIYSFKELMQYLCKTIRTDCMLIPLPFALAKFEAYFFEFLPKPFLTRDQVELLKYDNIVSPKSNNFETLGISPRSITTVVPSYLL